MNPLNVKSKDLMILFGFSSGTAKKRICEIKAQFRIEGCQLINYEHVAAYFGLNPERLLEMMRVK